MSSYSVTIFFATDFNTYCQNGPRVQPQNSKGVDIKCVKCDCLDKMRPNFGSLCTERGKKGRNFSKVCCFSFSPTNRTKPEFRNFETFSLEQSLILLSLIFLCPWKIKITQGPNFLLPRNGHFFCSGLNRKFYQDSAHWDLKSVQNISCHISRYMYYVYSYIYIANY